MDQADFEQILGTVREFVRKEVVPAEDEIEENDAIPDRIRKQAAEMGLFGWALPEEHGGLGLSMSEDVRLAMELGWTTPSFRSLLGTNNGIAGQVIVRHGTPEQKETWLPRLASGEAIASFALTEPEAGSDPSGLRTTARRDGDDYVINGSKRFITNAPLADLFVVFARTDPTATGTHGISVLLVEAGTPGITVGPPNHKMGQLGAWTAEVAFEDVRVPVSALVGGQEETGFRAAMASLSRGRLHIAAICVGMAQRLVDEMTAYVSTAEQGGAPISRFQLVQAQVAESYAETYAGRAMVLAAAEAYDQDVDRKLGPSSAKLYCAEMVDRVADRAVQVHGGTGYMRGTVVERCYRDARLFRIYEGTSEVQKLVIARALLASR